MSEPEHVEDIPVAPIPDTKLPGRGALDPADTYAEGVDGDPGKAE